MEIAQLLVVNFVVFRREVEFQSFYSAILILSPFLSFLNWLLINGFVDTGKIYDLFICLLAIWMSSFVKNLFISFTHFFFHWAGSIFLIDLQKLFTYSRCKSFVRHLYSECATILMMVSLEEESWLILTWNIFTNFSSIVITSLLFKHFFFSNSMSPKLYLFLQSSIIYLFLLDRKSIRNRVSCMLFKPILCSRQSYLLMRASLNAFVWNQSPVHDVCSLGRFVYSELSKLKTNFSCPFIPCTCTRSWRKSDFL